MMIVAALPASQRRFLFAFRRAPEQESDVLTTSAAFSPSAAPTPGPRILATEQARPPRSRRDHARRPPPLCRAREPSATLKSP